MQKRHHDQIAAVVLFVFSLFVYFVLIPYQIPPDRLGLSSSFFPELSVIVIGILSVLLFLKAKFTASPLERKKVVLMHAEEAKRVGTIYALMCLYVLLLYFLGFIVSTPLVLGSMLYYSGQRQKKIFWPILVLLTATIYIFFEFGMKLMLPRGLFG